MGTPAGETMTVKTTPLAQKDPPTMETNTLPTANTSGAAHSRAEAVLSYYCRSTGRPGRGGGFAEAVADLIADLAILCEIESGIDAAEAQADGGIGCGCGCGGTVETICEQGAGLARDLLDAEDEESRMEG